MTQNRWPPPPKSPGMFNSQGNQGMCCPAGLGGRSAEDKSQLQSAPSSAGNTLCANTPVPPPHPLIPKEIFGIRSSSVLPRSAKTKKKRRRLLLPPCAIPSTPTHPIQLQQLKHRTTRKGQVLRLILSFSNIMDSLERDFSTLVCVIYHQRSLKSALTSGFNRGMDHPTKKKSAFP